MNETLKTWEANSHLLARCPPHSGTNGQIFQVLNCPLQELQNQIKFPKIFRWNISEDIRNTPSQRKNFHSPAGARLARLNMTFPKWWAPNLVSVPPEIWKYIKEAKILSRKLKPNSTLKTLLGVTIKFQKRERVSNNPNFLQVSFFITGHY